MEKVEDKWSWIACAAGFWTLLFIQGTVRSAGLFYASTVEQWHFNRADSAWSFNLLAALEGFGMLLSGISHQGNIVCRGAIVAVLLFCAGFALSSITNNIYILIMLIGVIGGLCHGYIIAASFVCICHSFTHHRNIAMGLTVSGSSVGGIVLPYLYSYLIQIYTLNHAYLLVSGVSLQAMISVMLCRLVTIVNSEKRFIKKQRGQTENLRLTSIETEGTNSNSCSVIQHDNTFISTKERKFYQKAIKTFKKKLVLLRHPVLYIYAVSFAILIFCTWFWFIIIVDVAKDKGFSRNFGTSLISAASIGGLIGRFSFGWTIDFGLIKRKTGLIILFFAMSLALTLMPFLFNIYVLVILSGFFGLFTGSIVSLRASIPASYFGVKEMSFALGLSGVLSSGTSMLRPTLIGFFREEKGSYDILFYILGALACFASVLWLMEPFVMKMYNRKQKEIQNENINI